MANSSEEGFNLDGLCNSITQCVCRLRQKRKAARKLASDIRDRANYNVETKQRQDQNIGQVAQASQAFNLQWNRYGL